MSTEFVCVSLNNRPPRRVQPYAQDTRQGRLALRLRHPRPTRLYHEFAVLSRLGGGGPTGMDAASKSLNTWGDTASRKPSRACPPRGACRAAAIPAAPSATGSCVRTWSIGAARAGGERDEPHHGDRGALVAEHAAARNRRERQDQEAWIRIDAQASGIAIEQHGVRAHDVPVENATNMVTPSRAAGRAGGRDPCSDRLYHVGGGSDRIGIPISASPLARVRSPRSSRPRSRTRSPRSHPASSCRARVQSTCWRARRGRTPPRSEATANSGSPARRRSTNGSTATPRSVPIGTKKLPQRRIV